MGGWVVGCLGYRQWRPICTGSGCPDRCRWAVLAEQLIGFLTAFAPQEPCGTQRYVAAPVWILNTGVHHIPHLVIHKLR
jgi:hypothetical protein